MYDTIKKYLFLFLNGFSTFIGVCMILVGFVGDFTIGGSVGAILIGLPFISPLRKKIKEKINFKMRSIVYISLLVIGTIFLSTEPSTTSPIDTEISDNSNVDNINKNDQVNSEQNEKNAINNNENNKKDKLEKEYTSILSNQMKIAFNYVEKNNIDIYDFSERNEVNKQLSNISKEEAYKKAVYVKSNSKLFGDSYYSKTLYPDDAVYLYYGNFNNDNQPEGLGIFFEFTNQGQNSIDEESITLAYIGYFEDGLYDGYGVQFTIIDKNELYVATDEQIKENYNLVNDIEYEGYFEKGKRNGKGTEFLNNFLGISNSLNMYYIEKTENPYSDYLDYIVYTGDFKNNEINGNVKEYLNKILKYDGQFSDGNYNGKGKLYSSKTGKLIYDGEFKNSEYNGKGTLYDENGNIVHKGKFKNGDIH